MRARTIAAGMIAACAACPACVDAPVTSDEQPAIVGGTTTTTTAFPTIVDLEEVPGDWFCTGTLIDPSWVLTAAHCLQSETAGAVHVRIGDDDISDGIGGTVVDVSALEVHPDYSEGLWIHDVALAELASPITNVTPTLVDRSAVAIGTAVTQVGYGDSDNFGDGAGVLRELATTTADCSLANDPGISNANLLCFDASVHASCYGDSGGPAFITTASGLVVGGITSGGTGSAMSCTGSGVWDLYTAVGAELDFIDVFVPGPEAGSGSGSAPGGSPQGSSPPGAGDPGVPETATAGCSGGDSGGAWLAVALCGLVLARRRRAITARA